MNSVGLNDGIVVLPSFSILVVLSVGTVLSIRKPFYGYLFAVFLPLAMAIPTMTFTRFQGLGPYFNLYDACLLIIALASLLEILGSKVIPRPPLLPLAMIAVIAVGYVVSNLRYGFSYETLRALRWALNVPLYLLGGFVMLRSEKRHGKLLLVAVLAAIVAETYHLMLVLTSPFLGSVSGLGSLRSSMFMMAKSESWLLTGPYTVGGAVVLPWLQVAVGALLLAGAITTQTRTLAFGAIGAAILYFWLIVVWDAGRRGRYILIVAVVFLVTLVVVVPQTGLGDVAQNFGSRMTKFAQEGAVDHSAIARTRALKTEARDWYEGDAFTVVFGNGLDYFSQKYHLGREENKSGIAFGHLGYISYLSQLGVVGFLIYAVWFPIAVIRQSRLVYFSTEGPPTRHLAALGAVVFLYGVVAFLFSGHYLATDVLAGTLAGLLLAVPKRKRSKELVGAHK